MAFLELRGITKTFPGVIANQNVDLLVEKGTVHALVGENGAGKTTLMCVLYGMYIPDLGSIYLNGQKISIHSPQDAIAMGIGMVHQEFQLVPSLTVAENIVLGHEPKRGPWLDGKEIHRRVVALSEEFGLQVDPDRPVAELSVGVQQRVEILKLLYRQAEILILDEPTAVLTPQETDMLFAVLNHLVASGRTVIFITHKLKEVMTLCQKATVLRRGQVAGNLVVSQTSEMEITRMMMGQQVDIFHSRASKKVGQPVLEVTDLSAINNRGLLALRKVSFNVRAGEIVGIAGVEGNGQSELIEVLAGLHPSSGSVCLGGKEISRVSPRQRRLRGLALIPEDRRRQGLNLQGSIADNIIATCYFQPPYSRHGVLNSVAIERASVAGLENYQIKAENINSKLSTLSGGNAQKVIIARELARKPIFLLAAQPTRGLDVLSTQAVRMELARWKEEGVAVLLISADLDEILSISDRILVIFEGQIVGELSPKAATYEKLGLLMAGHYTDHMV
ncbi:MAG: ABC transporter ATP-binding protein [Anaerolineales bacterium]|nr:ABC transporter ATP-binding protein [Anaerolineales bacterium]